MCIFMFIYIYIYIYIAEILGEIKKAGFEAPTPIQVKINMLSHIYVV